MLDPAPPFREVLQALQDPDRLQQARDRLFALWLAGAPAPVQHAGGARATPSLGYGQPAAPALRSRSKTS